MCSVRIFTCKILDLVDEGVLDPKNVLHNLLIHLSESQVEEFWEDVYASDFEEEEEEEEESDDSDSDDDGEDYGEDDGEDGDDDGDDDGGGWQEESANMAGMAGGATAYNEAMGWGEGESEGG